VIHEISGLRATSHFNDQIDELTKGVVKAPLNSYHKALTGDSEQSREGLDSPFRLVRPFSQVCAVWRRHVLTLIFEKGAVNENGSEFDG
jgi:hypothetical protein